MHAHSQLEEDLATRARAHFKSPSPPPSVLSTSSSSSTGLMSPRGISEDPEEGGEKEEGEDLDETNPEVINELEYNDVVYRVGEMVYVSPLRYVCVL